MSEASRKRETFRELHRPGEPLLMANPWDIGSALLLKAKGAKAFGTTSAGHAFTLGRPDLGHVSRDEALAHARAITEATGLPVSGDFENGYGDAPEFVAETVEMAAAAGLAGLSIEDTIAPSGDPYSFDDAMARAEAAIGAAKRHGLVLTVRADGVLTGRYDAAEGVRRCLAYADLGADVVYAPALPAEEVKTLTASGARVNVLTTADMAALGVAGIAALGAARISIGSTLARVTQRVTLEVGEAIFAGDLRPLTGGAGRADVDRMLNG